MVPLAEAVALDPRPVPSGAALRTVKTELLHALACSLVHECAFAGFTPENSVIFGHVLTLAFYDPEFVLKAAVYTRRELNIRTTANAVLGYAAGLPSVQPHLRRYFGAAVVLPSDWLEVVTYYRAFYAERWVRAGHSARTLPAALRHALVAKFADFDEYQLAKYNKERAIKRRLRKQRELQQQEQQQEQERQEDGSSDSNCSKGEVTMKQMVRLLHLTTPQMTVMALLGKRYPATELDFLQARLPGTFDAARAGRRMRLPVPETWETLVALRGNTAATWETLIDHNKLPFMAMLRNLRNLLLTGVHARYHRWAMDRLRNERTVAASKQFPFRFLSAFDAVPADAAAYRRMLADANRADSAHPRARPFVPAEVPTDALLADYRAALDTAVQLAARTNIKHIPGATALFCGACAPPPPPQAAPGEAAADDGRARLGALQDTREIAVLLGLMCRHACEDCELRLLNERGECACVNADEGTVLGAVRPVVRAADAFGAPGATETFPHAWLEDALSRRVRYDTIALFVRSDCIDVRAQLLLERYRRDVNPAVLVVCHTVAAGAPAAHAVDDVVHVAGISDAVLRFIAERGDVALLSHVEHIDTAFALPAATAPAAALRDPVLLANAGFQKREHIDIAGPAVDGDANAEDEDKDKEDKEDEEEDSGDMKVIRVFISSTFLDMHGERDLLTRSVFPQLRARCARQGIRLEEVDLRWGLTEEDAHRGRTLGICLAEVRRCQIFVGFLGSRYGWYPRGDTYPVDVADPAFAWLQTYPRERSVTELEMHLGGHLGSGSGNSNPNAYFYFRDPAFDAQVPREHAAAFGAESDYCRERVAALKREIEAATENTVTYPASWGGVVDGKPVAAGMEALRRRLLYDLWEAVQRVAAAAAPVPGPAAPAPEEKEETAVAVAESPLLEQMKRLRRMHEGYRRSLTRVFVGRQAVLDAACGWLASAAARSNTLAVTGAAGAGKSAVAARLVETVRAQARRGCAIAVPTVVLAHFVGAEPSSLQLRGTLARLCLELSAVVHHGVPRDDAVPAPSGGSSSDDDDDVRALTQTFLALFESASFAVRLVLVVDGAERLDSAAPFLQLAPAARARVVLTAADGSALAAGLGARRAVPLALPALALGERRALVAACLGAYHKRLDERSGNDQMRLLLRKADAGSPQYLVLACEELRVHGVFETLTQRIGALGGTVPRLLDEMLARIEGDFGAAVVAAVLAPVAASRGGIAAPTLRRIAHRPTDEGEKVGEEAALPLGVWTPLRAALACFLRDVHGVVSLAGSTAAAAVTRRYLASRVRQTRVHAMLAAHYLDQCDPRHDGSCAGCSISGSHSDSDSDSHSHSNGEDAIATAVGEVGYHLWRAGQAAPLAALLTSLAFVEAKCRAGRVADLLADYARAALLGPLRDDVAAFRAFVHENAAVLAAHPALTCQQAANQPAASAPARAARLLLHCPGGRSGRAWVQWLNKPDAPAPCVAMFGRAGADAPASRVVFSPRGRYLAYATAADCAVHVVDAATRREHAVLAAHASRVADIAFSRDERRVATGAWDAAVVVWDVATAAVVARLPPQRERVSALLFLDSRSSSSSSSSSSLVVACWDGSVRVWDVERPRGEGLPLPPAGGTDADTDAPVPVNRLALAPGGRLLAGACWDGSVCVWDVGERRVLQRVRAHERSVKDCCWRTCGCGASDLYDLDDDSRDDDSDSTSEPEQLQLVTCGADGRVRLWSYPGLGLVSDVGVHHGAAANACACGRGTVASAADDWSVRVWDATLVHTAHAHALAGAPTGHALAADGAHVLVATRDCEVLVLRRGPGAAAHALARVGVLAERGRTHTRLVTAIVALPARRAVALASEAGTVSVWDAAGARIALLACPAAARAGAVLALAAAPDGTELAAGMENGTAAVWSTRTWQRVRTLGALDAPVCAIAYAPPPVAGDGKARQLVALGTRSGVVCVYDCARGGSSSSGGGSNAGGGPPVAYIRAHSDWVNALAWTPDGRTLVTASSDFTLRTWDMPRGRLRAVLRGHAGAVTQCAVVAGGRAVASAGRDGTLRVWATATGAALGGARLCPRGTPVLTLAAEGAPSAAAESTRLTVLGGDGVLRFVRVLRPAELARLCGHTARVAALAVSPADAHVLASASDDGTVRLWDWARDRAARAHAAHAHAGAVVAAAVTRDGTLVATVADTGDVVLWRPGTPGDAALTTVHIPARPRSAVFCCGSAPGSQHPHKLFVDCDDDEHSLYCVVPPPAATPQTEDAPGVAEVTRVAQFDGRVRAMAASADGTRLYVLKWVTSLAVVAAATGAVVAEVPLPLEYADVLAVARGTVYVANSNSAASVVDRAGTAGWFQYTGAQNPVSCLVAPAPARADAAYRVFAAHWDGTVCAVPADAPADAAGDALARPRFVPLRAAPVLCGALAPNERHLVLGRRDATVAVVDTRTWREAALFVCRAPVTALAVSPRSQLIIAGDALGNVYFLKYFRP